MESWSSVVGADALCRHVRSLACLGHWLMGPWDGTYRFFYPHLTLYTGEVPNRIRIECVYGWSECQGVILEHSLSFSDPIPGPSRLRSLQRLVDIFSQHECFSFWDLVQVGQSYSAILRGTLNRDPSATVEFPTPLDIFAQGAPSR